MKQLITVIAFLLFSCQKETFKPDKIEVVDYVIDETTWNTCTNEYMHLTGTARGTSKSATVDSVLSYSYRLVYNGVHGEGLTSGLKYTNSCVFVNWGKARLLPNGQYQMLTQDSYNLVTWVSTSGIVLTALELHYAIDPVSGVVIRDSRNTVTEDCIPR